jgi:hypothetical protein
MADKISPKWSMRGWAIKTWLVKNKDYIKTLGGAISGIIAFYMNIVPQPWNLLLAAVSAIVGKMILDTLDFWSSEVQLKRQ